MTDAEVKQARKPEESVASFQARARDWLAGNMPRLREGWNLIREDDDRASQSRELQRRLWDGGFAGICYPREYGGLGLPVEYQHAFDAVAQGYQLPVIFSTPTHSIIGPCLLDCASEAQKQRYIPAFLRGDELWVHFMSEPRGGSDMAGATTRATRDGDVFVLNGSKIWSTFAYRADFAIALVRTNWDALKHRGLTMLIVPIHHPGITVRQITMVDGSVEFCQEFFDDAIIGVENAVGAVNGGWTVASRLLFHERAAVGGSSPYLSVKNLHSGAPLEPFGQLARRAGRMDDPDLAEFLGEEEVLSTVQQQLVERTAASARTGQASEHAGTMPRLFTGVSLAQRATMALDLAGAEAAAWRPGRAGRDTGVDFVQRQARSIGGGTTEMARNIISERVMGMPREPSPDREVPFSQVPRGKVQ
jgi:alkylation response protein AidB-like acyl-CoA dehydrogenase